MKNNAPFIMQQSVLLLFYCFIAVVWRMELLVVSLIAFHLRQLYLQFLPHCNVPVIMVRVSWRSTL